jgi:hypothetical protein
MLRRQCEPADKGVPMTNFGVLIAYMKHVFPRALTPFPELYALFSKGSDPTADKVMARFTE